MAVNTQKLRALGYESVDDLPVSMLQGLDGATLELIHKELPSRNVVELPSSFDYRKGQAPARSALVLALQDADTEAGSPGQALRDAAAALILRAQNGDMNAWDRIADRLEGKPAQEVTANGSITHNHIHEAISATDAWLAGFAAGSEDRQIAEPVPDRPLLLTAIRAKPA